MKYGCKDRFPQRASPFYGKKHFDACTQRVVPCRQILYSHSTTLLLMSRNSSRQCLNDIARRGHITFDVEWRILSGFESCCR